MIPGITAQIGSGAGFEPPPLPTLPSEASITHWFRADLETFRDDVGTPATSGDGVRVWGNLGSATSDPAVQDTSGNRPIKRFGGLNGMPYLECPLGDARFFNDLAITQRSGITSLSAWRTFAFVIDDYDLATERLNPITGSNLTNGGKFGTYLRTAAASSNLRFFKSNITLGVIAQPMICVFVVGSETSFRCVINGNYYSQSQSTNGNSSAIAAMQFLRCMGSSAGSQYFDGKFYEFLAWGGSVAMNQANMEAVCDALNGIYEVY